MRNQVKIENQLKIIELYNSGQTQKEIALKFNLAQTTISGILKRNKIKARKGVHYKYTDVNYEFFKKIDSEEKAYFLGFMYADGNISSNKQTLSLEIHEKDKEILEKLQELLCPSIPIKKQKNRPHCYFKVSRKDICEQLIYLGCPPKKSLILKFPTKEQVPEHLIHHFFRGYLDGDGSIYVTNTTNFWFNITSTKDFCQEVESILNNKFDIAAYLYPASNLSIENNITTVLRVGGNLQVLKVLTWLYEDSHIFLSRKYNKFCSLKKQINKNQLSMKFLDRGSFKINEEKVINLYLLGNTKIKISEIMKCDYKTVRNILKKRQIPTNNELSHKRPNSISGSKSKEIADLYERGITINELSKKYNCGEDNIKHILRKNNIKIERKRK